MSVRQAPSQRRTASSGGSALAGISERQDGGPNARLQLVRQRQRNPEARIASGRDNMRNTERLRKSRLFDGAPSRCQMSVRPKDGCGRRFRP